MIIELLIKDEMIVFNSKVKKFTREQFCKLLNFAVKDSNFIFNKPLYEQIETSLCAQLNEVSCSLFL